MGAEPSFAGDGSAPAGRNQRVDGIALFSWALELLAPSACPDVDACRPVCCPGCQTLAVSDGRIMLWGHGPRRRGVLVVPLLRLPDRLVECWARRYSCQACGSCCTVLPKGLVARFLYSVWAVVAAWLLTAVCPVGEGLSETKAYRRQGLFDHADWTEATRYRWRSLRRWRVALPERLRGLELGVDVLLLAATARARDGTLAARIEAAVAQLH